MAAPTWTPSMYTRTVLPTAAEPATAEQIVKQIRRSETTTLAPRSLQRTVRVTGALTPAKQADVAAQVSMARLELYFLLESLSV